MSDTGKGESRPRICIRAARSLADLYHLLRQKTTVVLTALLAVGVATVLWHLSWTTSKLVEMTILQSAERYSEALTEIRTLYTSEVVARVRDHGIEVTHDYRAREGAIPLPATLSMMLGEHLGRESPGMQVKLYSPHPFPWRQPTGGLRDEFGVDAWAFFEQHSDRPFYRFETLLGRRILRYATADLMRAECINCPNTHPDTPKDDWRTGDVRGVLEIALPIDGIEAETRDELHSTFALIGAMSLLGLSGLALVNPSANI